MEFRRIKPEERVLTSLLSTIVYLGQESEDYRQRLENPLQHSEGYERLWAGFNETGKMCSCMHVHDFTVRYDGHDVGMGGVGGVATLPESRKGGYIRKIFEKCLPDMKENGKVFSFLYPFSYAFYRKFGYELGYTRNRITVPLKALAEQYPFPDGVDLYMPGGGIGPFAEIYDVFTRNMNLAVTRDEKAWERLVEKDPLVTKNYAYLHTDANGTPDAYLLYRLGGGHGGGDDGGNALRVRELAWINKEGLYAMFGFLGGFSPQFTNLRWEAPSGFNAHALFPEGYDVNVVRGAAGMNRVVNVPKALELLKAPAHNGSAVISVKDAFMPCNTGVYALEWEAGVMSVKTTDKAADLETDVETLAPLATGMLTTEEARYRKGVAINGNEEALKELFPHKNLYIMEYF